MAKPRDPEPDRPASAGRPASAPGAASGGTDPAARAGGPPADPSDGSAEGELAAAKASVAALEDRIRRQQAEFVNETRRIQRQSDERVKYAVQPVVTDLLTVADALHGGIEGMKGTEHERRVADGLRLVEKELLDVLARHGVARIDAVGRPFDPSVHEAVLEMAGPGAPRTVLQVTRPGFTLNGRVVRAAHVIVSKAARTDDAATGTDDAESDGRPAADVDDAGD